LSTILPTTGHHA